MKKILLLIAALLAAEVHAQLNLTFRSNLAYPGQNLANIGGYVDSLGNEYALVGYSQGLDIVDVTDPVNPVVKQTIPGIGSNWREVKTWQHYAYVTTEGCCNGLQIVDLSTLPGTVVFKNWKGTGGIANQLETIHALHIDNNGYLYLHGSNLYNGTTLIASLSDPWNPVYLGKLNGSAATYVHDGYAYNDTLWSCHIYNGYFGVWNVSNKTNPVLISSQNTPGAFTHNSWLNDERNVLFTTDEVDDSYLTAFDVSDPGNITELDRIQVTPGSQSVVHNTHTLNNYQVVSWYKDGVVIVDASRPDNMIVTGYYDTYTQGSGGGYEGCWGVYPYLPSGNILASDIDNGLFVLTPNYVRGCYLEGLVTDSSTGLPVNGATITISGQNISEQTKLNGLYKTGLATAGTYTVQVSKVGYYTRLFNNVSLSNGVLTTLDVQLVPVVTVTQTGQVVDIQGNPVANAIVKFENALLTKTALTDAAGNYSVPSFIPDSYTVFAGKWGYVTSCQNMNVNATPVTIVLTDGYYDDFSIDNNWFISGSSPSSWEIAVPVATFNNGFTSNPGNDVGADCGETAYITDNGGGGPWDHDVDFGTARLSSPVFDATIYNNPYVNYSRWYYNGGTINGSPDDTMKVYLSNGTATVLLETATPSTPDNSTWASKSFAINSYLTPTNNMQFIIEVRDSAPVANIVEGGLDYFSVSEGPTAVATHKMPVELQAYPNPFIGDLLLDYEVTGKSGTAVIVVTDATGRIVERMTVAPQGKIRLGRDWNPGIYMIMISTEEATKSIRISKLER